MNDENSNGLDESTEEDESTGPDEMYLGDIRETLLLKEIIKELRTMGIEINSIIDVGSGMSGTSRLLALTDKNIDTVVGVDIEAYNRTWNDIKLWEKLGDNKKNFYFLEGNIFDEAMINSQLKELKIEHFDICYLHQMLHHLRANDCKFHTDDDKCLLEIQPYCECEYQKCTNPIGKFHANRILNTLFTYSDILTS